MRTHASRHVQGWLLLTPAAILLIAFTHYPTVATLIDSVFSKATAIRPSRFVGALNYERMLDDPIFWKVLANNAWFALGTIPTSIALAIVMALFVNRALPGRAFVRVAYFTPTILPMIAVANIWLFFYTPDIGLIDQIASGLGLSGHNWLGDPATVLPAIMVM
ncbi:MAG: sugar ABC transporter permease, partial [Desulfobacteraceae bacterium]|nr:sugar ABC transporter permease [Desulfobacteraceae bacterium]